MFALNQIDVLITDSNLKKEDHTTLTKLGVDVMIA
jgi:hypothetical protein